jgi:Cys-tRNA(Pro) deacylase
VALWEFSVQGGAVRIHALRQGVILATMSSSDIGLANSMSRWNVLSSDTNPGDHRMTKYRIPSTAAIRLLKSEGIAYAVHSYRFHDKDVARSAAQELGIDEHLVVKTLVFEDDQRRPLLVLMHGDRQVSEKNLARALGMKSVTPCDRGRATRYTGYTVGGISPFGTKKRLAVCVEASILELPVIYINGGRRGLMLELSPADMQRVLSPMVVKVAR